MTVRLDSHELVHEHLAAVTALDHVLFEVDDPYALSSAEQDALRVALVDEAVQHHLAASDAYRAFSERRGGAAGRIRSVADLDAVAQVPATCFKRVELTSMPVAAMAKRCTSSGTMGTTSVVWRDRTTIERLLGSVRRGIALVGEWLDDEVEVVNLGPDSDEAGDLWISYVLSLVELLYPTTHCVTGGELRLELALDGIERTLAEGRVVALVGPPALIARVAASSELGARGIRGGEQLVVVSAGGWKTPGGSSIAPDEFRVRVTDRLGLSTDAQMRDAFNQVELNTVVVECEMHRKHVPPWLHVTARDPVRLSALPEGHVGLLSYLDPTAVSYPCFIVADDFGRVTSEPCACGRHGRVIEIVRRVERRESWGCALKIAKTTGVG